MKPRLRAAACDFNTRKGSSNAHHEGLRKSGSHSRRALLKCHQNWKGRSSDRCRDTGLAFLAFALFALITRARVQAHRLSSVLALHEGVPRAMDHHSSGCLPAEKFPTCASDRQDRGATTLSDFRRQFHLTRLRDVAQEESPAYVQWICTTSALVRLACDNRASAESSTGPHK